MLVLFVCFIVFHATFNNISVIPWQSVLLVEETGVPGENHRPVAVQSVPITTDVVNSNFDQGEVNNIM
jgi:hypothetical protein